MPIKIDKDKANEDTLEETVLNIINSAKTELGIHKEYTITEF